MDRFVDAKLRVKDATDLVALIESYLPLSFTTYQTTSAIKNVKVTKIAGAK